MKVVIFGNSGSGKSFLSKKLAHKYSLAHMDLDTIAWLDTLPPQRKPIHESELMINQFMRKQDRWVIEGCYSDLLSIAINHSNKIVFLNPGIEKCIEHCKNRPWEQHKYESLEAQNKNFDMLINWVRQYPLRDDEFSLQAHLEIYNQFRGEKFNFTHPEQYKL